MTLKQRRQAAGGNGKATPEKKSLAAQLPGDHPSEDSRYPKTSDVRPARKILHVIETSGLLPELEKRLRFHPGRKSRLTLKTLLLGMVLAGEEEDRCLRSDICSTINGLYYRLGIELGLWTSGTRHPISYTTVVKQVLRLETALMQTWFTNSGGVRSIDWFMHKFLSATIPWALKTEITANAMDWTPIETWAVTKDFRVEKEVRKYQTPVENPEIGELDLKWHLHRSACLDKPAFTSGTHREGRLSRPPPPKHPIEGHGRR